MRTRDRVLDLDSALLTPVRLLAVALAAVLWVPTTIPAGAQSEGPPMERDYVSCGHFETQADAQEVLDSGTLDENGVTSLDADGDAIACEDAFGTGAPEADAAPAPVTVRALPSTGSGAIVTGDSAFMLFAGFATVSVVAAMVVRQQSRR